MKSTRKPLTEAQRIERRKYHREWERRTYASRPRIRVFTPEEKARRHENYLKNKTRYVAAQNARRKANPEQRKKWDKAYYLNHRDKELARGKVWVANNRDKRKVVDKRCKLKHAEKYKEAGRKHYLLNREKYAAYSKNNRPRFRKWMSEWRKRNPEKVKAMERKRVESGQAAEQSQKRRARIRGNYQESCTEKIAFLRLLPICHYCFGLIDGKPTIDHVTPISRGGAHAPGNLVAACQHCNSQKHNKLLSEWNGRVMEEAA